VIELIRQTRPRIVLAPYWEDRHPDHVRASHLVKEASFFAGVGKLGQGEPYRPSWLFYYLLHTPFTPTFIMDVSSVWERRMAAVRAYESQFLSTDREATTALSRPGFLRSLEGRAMGYGWMIQTAYGEPFLSATPLSASGFPGLQDRGAFPM
jgi:LmbE family N-acetylglucosaminyl deacetylase